MNTADQELILRVLAESARKLAPDARWARAVAATGWSPLEIVEHLVLTEAVVLRMVRDKLPRNPEAEPNAELDAWLMQRIADQDGKAERRDAPERTRPTGQYATAEEALAAFRAARENTMEWVRSTDTEQLRRHRLTHPAAGDLDGVQWLLFLAAHTERHVRQIEKLLGADDSAVAGA